MKQALLDSPLLYFMFEIIFVCSCMYDVCMLICMWVCIHVCACDCQGQRATSLVLSTLFVYLR